LQETSEVCLVAHEKEANETRSKSLELNSLMAQLAGLAEDAAAPLPSSLRTTHVASSMQPGGGGEDHKKGVHMGGFKPHKKGGVGGHGEGGGRKRRGGLDGEGGREEGEGEGGGGLEAKELEDELAAQLAAHDHLTAQMVT
jgi:hypothetical protein